MWYTCVQIRSRSTGQMDDAAKDWSDLVGRHFSHLLAAAGLDASYMIVQHDLARQRCSGLGSKWQADLYSFADHKWAHIKKCSRVNHYYIDSADILHRHCVVTLYTDIGRMQMWDPHLFSESADCLVLIQQLLFPFYQLQLLLCQFQPAPEISLSYLSLV